MHQYYSVDLDTKETFSAFDYSNHAYIGFYMYRETLLDEPEKGRIERDPYYTIQLISDYREVLSVHCSLAYNTGKLSKHDTRERPYLALVKIEIDVLLSTSQCFMDIANFYYRLSFEENNKGNYDLSKLFRETSIQAGNLVDIMFKAVLFLSS